MRKPPHIFLFDSYVKHDTFDFETRIVSVKMLTNYDYFYNLLLNKVGFTNILNPDIIDAGSTIVKT